MAPVWMTIWKSLPRSSLKLSRSAAQDQVAGGGYRQELGESLDNAQHDNLQQKQRIHSGLRADR